jgi:hypothetical protein
MTKQNPNEGVFFDHHDDDDITSHFRGAIHNDHDRNGGDGRGRGDHSQGPLSTNHKSFLQSQQQGLVHQFGGLEPPPGNASKTNHVFVGDKTVTLTHSTTPTSVLVHPPSHVPPNMNSSETTTFSNDTWAGRLLIRLSHIFNRKQDSRRSPATFAGFLSLLLLTMSNYMLGPMRDAAALKVGVSYIPMLTLVSTILALASSVPVGWLFEAPNPERKGRRWRGRIGLTRGETQGTSLALFLRCFAVCLFGYAFSFN